MMWTQMRNGVRREMERNVDELHDMRKKKKKEKQGRKEGHSF